MPARSPASADLTEALRWMVAHSQASADELTPGPLELAEVLWLAWQLPDQPRLRDDVRHERSSVPAQSVPGASKTPPQPDPPRNEMRPAGSAQPPDPFLPTPFPGATDQRPLEDPLLPVAVLPDQHDVERNLAGMVLPGRVQEEAPLGDRGKLLRALAPLLRRRPDPHRQRFDEERTVELFAQCGLLLPVFQPSQGPAFDEVLLLRDGGVSMQVWQRQAEELQRVLASTQVFPRVRLQELQPGPVERSQDSAAHQQAVEQLSAAARLLQGSRSLLLVLSDTAGRHWWDGRMFGVLQRWGRACPTAILQPLPIWHWTRTALVAAERVSVRNSSAAAANPAYGADRLHWWEEPLPPGRDLPLPVLPLDRRALGTWGAMVMGNPSHATAGVALPPQPLLRQRLRQVLGDRDLAAPSPTPEPLTAQEAAARWEAFQAMASPQAQQLMLAMASSPLLTLPVIELLKAAKLPEVAGSLPIAEVLSSGLVVRKPDRRQQAREREADSAQPLRAEQIQFEVLSEVAALLREQLPARERRDVISRVSALVERRWNRNRRSGEPSFEAVLCDPSVDPPKGMEGVVQFAAVTARLLDTLPGEAARAFAERIRKGSRLPPGSPWPASMAFQAHPFPTAQLLDTPELSPVIVSAARWHEAPLQQVVYQTLRPADLAAFLLQAGKEGGPAARASLPTATTRAFHEPLQRDRLPFGATAERPDPLALTLVEIPEGSFLMGSPPDESERSRDEGPQHEVKLASFFISQTPITQAQWREVASWQPLPAERWGGDLKPEPSRFRSREGQAEGGVDLFPGEASTDRRPVECVSWHDAIEFCNRLSQRSGRHYTLPSEAQWEYACRAGTTTAFHFGEMITPELANYDGNHVYAGGPNGLYREQTTPVGMFPANAWGLQDMHGTVWEWCLDHWHDSYEGAPADGSAWCTSAEPKKKAMTDKAKNSDSEEPGRLLRGGSWFDDPGGCRSAYRGRYRPGFAYGFVGFRVVCLPQGPSLNS